MLFLAKLAGVLVLVWFFLSAKEKGEPPYKWAIIGLVGYWITWWAVRLTVVNALAGMFAKSATMTFIVIQIPALCAIAAAVLIRKKLLADAAEK
ncbi:MAG: hypothetical protein NTV43_10905 [Methylococcales bacterium]|nr:hypothetical protein [Methylococcales bacterium]